VQVLQTGKAGKYTLNLENPFFGWFLLICSSASVSKTDLEE